MPIIEMETQSDIYNPETVKLRRNDDTAIRVLTDAVRYPISSQEMMRSRGFYIATDEIWTCGATGVGNWQIKQGWIIEGADGDRNIVVGQTFSRALQFWRLITRNLSIVHQLTDVVEVWRSIQTKDSSGRVSNTGYTSVITNLKARVQPIDKETGMTIGVLRLSSPFVIPIEYDPGIKLNDQIRLPDGKIYEVLAVKNTDELAALPHIECVYNGALWNG